MHTSCIQVASEGAWMLPSSQGHRRPASPSHTPARHDAPRRVRRSEPTRKGKMVEHRQLSWTLKPVVLFFVLPVCTDSMFCYCFRQLFLRLVWSYLKCLKGVAIHDSLEARGHSESRLQTSAQAFANHAKLMRLKDSK